MVFYDVIRRTYPSRARQALSLLLVPPKAGDSNSAGMPAIKFFDQLEIYPGAWTSVPKFYYLSVKMRRYQVLRLHTSNSFTKRQGYLTVRW
jgi:hypothetical protein